MPVARSGGVIFLSAYSEFCICNVNRPSLDNKFITVSSLKESLADSQTPAICVHSLYFIEKSTLYCVLSTPISALHDSFIVIDNHISYLCVFRT